MLNAISDFSTLKMEIVEEKPVENIKTDTIYLILANSPKEENVYKEWIYINNNWELIGTTDIDLSNYYTKNEVNNLIPFRTSDLINDSNFITSNENPTIYKSSKMPPWIISDFANSIYTCKNKINTLPYKIGDLWVFNPGSYYSNDIVFYLSNFYFYKISNNNWIVLLDWKKNSSDISQYNGYYGTVFDYDKAYKNLEEINYSQNEGNITAVPRPSCLVGDFLVQNFYVENSSFYIYYFHKISSISKKIIQNDESQQSKTVFNIQLNYFKFLSNSLIFRKQVQMKNPPIWVEKNYDMFYRSEDYQNTLWINSNTNRLYYLNFALNSQIKEGKKFSWISLTNKVFYSEEEPPQIKIQKSQQSKYDEHYYNDYIEISQYQTDDIYIAPSGIYKCLNVIEDNDVSYDENENVKIQYSYQWEKISSNYYTKQETDNLLLNKETISNKTISISSSSTDDQYPSAKAVYDAINYNSIIEWRYNENESTENHNIYNAYLYNDKDNLNPLTWNQLYDRFRHTNFISRIVLKNLNNNTYEIHELQMWFILNSLDDTLLKFHCYGFGSGKEVGILNSSDKAYFIDTIS